MFGWAWHSAPIFCAVATAPASRDQRNERYVSASCYHRLNAMKYLYLPTIVLLSMAIHAQSADEIVAKSIAARGGMDKIKAIETVRLTSKIVLGASMQGKLV